MLMGHTNSVRCLDVWGNQVVSGSYDTTCRVRCPFLSLPRLRNDAYVWAGGLVVGRGHGGMYSRAEGSLPPDLLSRVRWCAYRVRGTGYHCPRVGRCHRVRLAINSQLILFLKKKKQPMHRPPAGPHRARMPAPALPHHPRDRRVRRARDHLLPRHLHRPAPHRRARLLRHLAAVRQALPRHGRQRRAGAAVRDGDGELHTGAERAERERVEGRVWERDVCGHVQEGGEGGYGDLELEAEGGG